MANQASLQTLADLLRGSRAKLVIEPARFAPSTIYDLEYRLVVLACTFEIHSKTNGRLHAAKLKMMQFIAVRPWLLPVVQDWAASQKQKQTPMLESQSFRRGFLSDEMHERVVDYLVAHDVFRRERNTLVASANGAFLSRLAATADRSNLFAEERRILTDLLQVRITNNMLEGR